MPSSLTLPGGFCAPDPPRHARATGPLPRRHILLAGVGEVNFCLRRRKTAYIVGEARSHAGEPVKESMSDVVVRRRRKAGGVAWLSGVVPALLGPEAAWAHHPGGDVGHPGSSVAWFFVAGLIVAIAMIAWAVWAPDRAETDEDDDDGPQS
jgi:hypothetical protein